MTVPVGEGVDTVEPVIDIVDKLRASFGSEQLAFGAIEVLHLSDLCTAFVEGQCGDFRSAGVTWMLATVCA